MSFGRRVFNHIAGFDTGRSRSFRVLFLYATEGRIDCEDKCVAWLRFGRKRQRTCRRIENELSGEKARKGFKTAKSSNQQAYKIQGVPEIFEPLQIKQDSLHNS
jgi:hypothetical protein